MARYDPTFTPGQRDQVLRRAASPHPLEMFPVFRRWPGGLWRDLVYTFIWNVGFTALFLFIGLVDSMRLPSAASLWSTFIVANCIGYCLHAIFMLAGDALARLSATRGRTAVMVAYVAISTAGVLLGFALASLLLGRSYLPLLEEPRWIIAIAVTSIVISAVLAVVFFWREKSALAEAALEREQRRAADIEREAMAANLRALQAQIEPHFLFNTLANATSLIDADPARARHMLESFIRFLRASLAATRRPSTTLGDEFALVGDFLSVLGVRMAGRLAVRVDLPAELAAREIPPMLVQPLVENAIRHGLEPRVEGGEIALRARRDGDRLVVEVADTGVGFAAAVSGGVGLANVRERLRLTHGDRARLVIRGNSPQGTVAAIELPLETP
ncbi:MAG: sensor histidine kinase [Burkholderiales bacterium]